MSQFNTLVLKDHAGTDHSFVPRDITGGVATAVNSTGVPIGERTVSFAASRTTTGRRKVTMKMALPITQDVVVNGISKPTIVRSAYVDITFAFDGTSNTSERQDVLAYVQSLLAETSQIEPLVTNLAAPF